MNLFDLVSGFNGCIDLIGSIIPKQDAALIDEINHKNDRRETSVKMLRQLDLWHDKVMDIAGRPVCYENRPEVLSSGEDMQSCPAPKRPSIYMNYLSDNEYRDLFDRAINIGGEDSTKLVKLLKEYKKNACNLAVAVYHL